MKLEFREIEDIFSARYGIVTDHGKAFRGRLQHLQRLGFPEGVNTGKGKKAEYGWKQFIQLSLVLDLIDMGIAPDAATTMIKSNWADIEFAISSLPDTFGNASKFAAAIDAQTCPLDKSIIMLIEVAAISSMRQDGLTKARCLYLISGKDFLKRVKERDPYSATTIAIDLTVRLLLSIDIMRVQMNLLPLDVALDLAEWGSSNGKH